MGDYKNFGGPLCAYYASEDGTQHAFVNYAKEYLSDAPQYEVVANGKKMVMDAREIRRVLERMQAVRIGTKQFKGVLEKQNN